MTLAPLRRLVLPLVALAAGRAFASAPVPVVLPPGEQAADWAEPLALAGLAIGAAGAGPSVEVVAGGSGWVVRVHDVRGELHEAPIRRPASPQDREDLAFLAASLLQPVASPPPAPVEPPPPRPRPTPVATVTAPPPVVVAPPPPEPAPPEPAPPEPTPPAAPSFRVEGRAGLGVEARPGSIPTASAWLGARLAREGPLRPGLELGATLPGEIVGLDVRYWSAEADLGIWYAARDLPLDFGLTGGVVVRRFLADSVPDLAPLAIPVVGTELGVGFRAGPLILEPGARLQADLRPVDLEPVDGARVRVGEWSVRAGLTIRAAEEK